MLGRVFGAGTAAPMPTGIVVGTSVSLRFEGSMPGHERRAYYGWADGGRPGDDDYCVFFWGRDCCVARGRDYRDDLDRVVRRFARILATEPWLFSVFPDYRALLCLGLYGGAAFFSG